MSVGDNWEFGGANDSSYTFAASLARGTVGIEGRKVIEDGK